MRQLNLKINNQVEPKKALSESNSRYFLARNLAEYQKEFNQVPPLLHLAVWKVKRVGKDKEIGTYQLNLSELETGKLHDIWKPIMITPSKPLPLISRRPTLNSKPSSAPPSPPKPTLKSSVSQLEPLSNSNLPALLVSENKPSRKSINQLLKKQMNVPPPSYANPDPSLNPELLVRAQILFQTDTCAFFQLTQSLESTLTNLVFDRDLILISTICDSFSHTAYYDNVIF